MINNLQSILTQSSSMTSDPIFCVYSKQEVVVDPNYSYDKCFYVKRTSDDYPQITVEEFDELRFAYNDATHYRCLHFDSKGNQIDYPMPEDPCSGGDFNPDDWELVYVKLVDRFEQAFFIRENAENFIARNKHNLGASAYIFVESAYRNPEWRQVRELLIAAAKKNENSFGELKFGLEYKNIVDGMWVVYSELPISNYANSLKRLSKTEEGWSEYTIAVEWDGKYVVSTNEHSFERNIWDSGCYAPVEYDEKIPPVEFMNKVLPLTIKGEID